MSLRCSNCNNDVTNVGEVRSCGTCQRNGTAGGVHAKFENHDSVEAMVAEANPGAFPFVPPIPVYTDERIEQAAMAAHEANRAYCISIGDKTQKPWKKAPDWQKDSARLGIRFLIANPDAPDSATHDSWMAQKVADGWVYGETKDAEAKTHPCIVPFDQLPAEQQEKDRIFKATARAALAA